jgi:hypothetical protein
MSEQAPISPTPDWAVIEADYRAGIKSLRTIAGEHGVAESTIRKRANKEDWARDLGAKIQAKADALVRSSAVRSEVRTKARIPEHVVVDANADAVFHVRMSQRSDIQRALDLCRKLFGEIEAQTDNAELFAKLGELMDESSTDQETGRQRRDLLNEAYRKALSTAGRIDSAKKATEILEKGVRMQREAFGIEGAGSAGQDPLTSLLAKIGRSAMPVVQEVPEDD